MLRSIIAAIPLLLAMPALAADNVLANLLLLQSVEERVASIGYRLATSAGDLCSDTTMLAGIQIHDASQYGPAESRQLAAAFGPGPWPKVLALAAGGAAARAGVRANDSILAIDGTPAPATGRQQSYDRVWYTLALLDHAMADGHAVLTLERDGKPLTIDVAGDRGCASRFSFTTSRDPQGKADGSYVVITSGLVTFAPKDAELAAAMAHELAHNILHHRQRLDAAGVSRGILQSFGRNARLTRETETEADRLSVYLLDRAGYPPTAALSFWDRFRKASSDLLVFTHPSSGNRIRTLQTEIARIEAAKARGEVPRFVPDSGQASGNRKSE